MFGWLSPSKVRRREVRKQLAQNQISTGRRILEFVVQWPILALVMFASASVAIALVGRQSSPWVVGASLDRPIPSKVRFTYEDQARFAELQEQARAKTPSYYRLNLRPIDQMAADLRALYEAAKASESAEAFLARPEVASWQVEPGEYKALRSYSDDANAQDFLARVDRLRSLMMAEYTAEPRTKEDRQPPGTEDLIRVEIESGESAPPKVVEISAIEQLVFVTQTRPLEGVAARLASQFPEPMISLGRRVILKAIQSEPTLIFDKARTQEAMQESASKVEPVVIPVEPGQELIAPIANKRLILTEQNIELLNRHDEAYRAFLASADPEATEIRNVLFLDGVGTCVIFLLLSISLFAYLKLTKPRVLEIPSRTLAVAGLFLGAWVVVRVVDSRWPQQELMLAPTLIAVAVLTIAYDRWFAFGVGAILTTMMVLSIEGSFHLFVTTLLMLAVATSLLSEIRTRMRLVYAGLTAAAVASISTLALDLTDQQTWKFSIVQSLWAGGSTLMGAMMIQGALPFIERWFGIATALTLLEWRDASKSLLQRLAREAPGTYAHSLVLSTMTEAACEAVKANGLLTSVGALYHDIGKIPKAEYFTENQEASLNLHDRLAPNMSLLIIIGHVKDGVEMAKEYGLPRALFRFIEEHHGTTLVRFFHHAAQEKQPKIASGRHDRTVAESEFRYPGPKPRSKETAILMICDGTEGAVRSLPEPTAGRIESVVHSMVMDRLNDGQFDDCDITLRELRLVEESVVKSLVRFYHGRVAYPKGGAKLTPTHEPVVATVESIKTSTA